jgi:diguanylate cyclase (GGDEF)-like protein
MQERSSIPGSWVVRASIVGLLAVLCFLAGFSLITQRRTSALSQQADQANRLSEVYQDARFWVGQEESLERKYRLEPSPDVRALHQQAERNLVNDVRRLSSVDPTPANRAIVQRLLTLHIAYAGTSAAMVRAVDAHNPALVIHLDHAVVDPVFGQLQAIVYRNAGFASRRALTLSASLRRNENDVMVAIAIAIAVGLGLLLAFALIIARFGRRLDAGRTAEVTRLAEIAITDPLTGLRNHRAFHEDLARNVHRVARSAVPVSLVILDVDGLKQVNDSLGHQAGDEHLRSLADAIRVTVRGSDCGYRIGGDEFAIILDNSRSWGAMEFVRRLQDLLATAPTESGARASAGISEALVFTDKDKLIREADLALIATKRSGQCVAIYTPELEPRIATADSAADEHYSQTLASALAHAVDAKDSYTHSHSQTVSQLCALIASELHFNDERVARMRLAGLLHDVGKIGVPDAILNKPAKLTDDEREQMQAHSVLGYEIVSAANLSTEADWVRHHHERYDGHGYPDQLSGDEIPIESRIIFVADSFEAMTSDRPYRKSPGTAYALAELRGNAGTQFDPEIVGAFIRAIKTPGPGGRLAQERTPATPVAHPT